MPKLLRFVAWAQIITGAIVAVWSIFSLYLDTDALFFESLFIILGLWSCVAGTLLLKASKLGWYSSVLLQLIQLPSFSLGMTQYRLGLGALLRFGIEIPMVSGEGGYFSLVANSGFVTDYSVSFGQVLDEYYLSINVVALVFLMTLLRNRPARNHASGT